MGLGEELHLGEPGRRQGRAQTVAAEVAPGGGPGDHHPARRAALALGDPRQHPRDDHRGDLLGRPRLAAHHGRDVVAEPSLHLADHAVRLVAGAALGALPDEDVPSAPR